MGDEPERTDDVGIMIGLLREMLVMLEEIYVTLKGGPSTDEPSDPVVEEELIPEPIED